MSPCLEYIKTPILEKVHSRKPTDFQVVRRKIKLNNLTANKSIINGNGVWIPGPTGKGGLVIFEPGSDDEGGSWRE
jgi:hypothetical protein